jgi:hypothetical protein
VWHRTIVVGPAVGAQLVVAAVQFDLDDLAGLDAAHVADHEVGRRVAESRSDTRRRCSPS